LIASHVNLHPTLFLQKLTHIINTSTTCTFQLHTEVNIVIFHFIFICQGIAQQPGTRKIAHLFAFHLPPATWFSKMRMSVKVKYGFVLHTGIAGSRFYFRIIISYLKRSGMTQQENLKLTLQVLVYMFYRICVHNNSVLDLLECYHNNYIQIWSQILQGRYPWNSPLAWYYKSYIHTLLYDNFIWII
jgi:hypothetical protein